MVENGYLYYIIYYKFYPKMLPISEHSLPINPFLYDLQVDLIEFKEETYVVTVVEGLKEPTGQMSANVRQTESQKFTKVYELPYRNGFIKNFTKSGLVLFNYLVYNLEVDKDIIDLELERVNKRLDWSKETYRKAVAELVANSVIERVTNKHKDYRYWINPKIMFRGDRKSYVRNRLPENCRVVKSFTNRHYVGSVTVSH